LDVQNIGAPARYPISRRRIALVGKDDTRVSGGLASSESPTGCESRRPIIERLMGGTELRVSSQAAADGEPTILCETQGAMSQQSSDAAHGHESVPQKLLHLVGYRDPNTGPDTWHRPRRNGGG
jgi:hypothetical protein